MTNQKVVYITGASKGIGEGIAAFLLKNGYRVAISSRSLEAASKTAQKLGNSENVLPLQSDVRSFTDEQKAVAAIIEKWGQLDVLVANAGVGHYAPISELSHDQWNAMIDTNLTGVFNSTKAALEAITKAKGYIITIGSLAGANFFAGGTGYNASKFAIVGYSQALMLDLRQQDVKVTTIMPGSVASHFNNNEPSEKDAWKIQPEDIGELVSDLLQMHPRSLPSKVEIRPSKPPVKA